MKSVVVLLQASYFILIRGVCILITGNVFSGKIICIPVVRILDLTFCQEKLHPLDLTSVHLKALLFWPPAGLHSS